MKLSIIVMFCLLALRSDGNKMFKVLVVTTSVRAQSGELFPMAVIPGETVIEIPRGHYIALMDEYTNLYEFYGEKTVFLDTLKGGSITKTSMPELERIYSSEKFLQKPVWNDQTDSIGIVFPYPFCISFRLKPNQELCLKWTLFSNKKEDIEYRIIVMSQYEEMLSAKSITANSDCLRLPSAKSSKKRIGVLVSISESDKKNVRSSPKLIMVENFASHDVALNASSPIVNVISALYCEERGLTAQAEVFFMRAVDSSRGIEQFNDLLRNFRLRNGI